MACTEFDLRAAYVAGADALFVKIGGVETVAQTTARVAQEQAAAIAAFPLPGPAVRVVNITLLDGTQWQIRVVNGKLEALIAGTWQIVNQRIELDKLGASGLATLADLFAHPTV